MEKNNSNKFKKVLPVVLAASVATSNVPFAVFADEYVPVEIGAEAIADAKININNLSVKPSSDGSDYNRGNYTIGTIIDSGSVEMDEFLNITGSKQLYTVPVVSSAPLTFTTTQGCMIGVVIGVDGDKSYISNPYNSSGVTWDESTDGVATQHGGSAGDVLIWFDPAKNNNLLTDSDGNTIAWDTYSMGRMLTVDTADGSADDGEMVKLVFDFTSYEETKIKEAEAIIKTALESIVELDSTVTDAAAAKENLESQLETALSTKLNDYKVTYSIEEVGFKDANGDPAEYSFTVLTKFDYSSYGTKYTATNDTYGYKQTIYGVNSTSSFVLDLQEWSRTDTVSIEVAPAITEISITSAGVSFIENPTDNVKAYTIEELILSDSEIEATDHYTTSVEEIAPANEGEADARVTVTLTDAGKKIYSFANGATSATIDVVAEDKTPNEEDLTQQTLSFENAIQNVTYGDVAFTQAVTGAGTTVTYSSSDTSVATVDSTTGEVTIVGAGSANITASAVITQDFASAELSYKVNVAKKSVSISSANVNDKDYDGTTAATVGSVLFSGTVSGDTFTSGTDYTTSAVFASANAGDAQAVTVSVSMLNSNYTLSGSTYTTTANIAKATYEDITITELVDGTSSYHVVDLSSYAALVNGSLNKDEVNNIVFGEGNDVSIAKDGSYSASYSFTIESDNYNDVAVTVIMNIAGKAIPSVSASSLTKVYNGEVVTLDDITKSADVDGEWTWTAGDSISEAAGTTQVTLTFTPDDTDTYETITKLIIVTINKATVTVSADNFSMSVDGTLPEYTYSIIGAVKSEDLSGDVTLTCNAVVSKAGTYDIIPTGVSIESSVAGNYNDIIFENGTLTIKEKVPSLDSGSTGGSTDTTTPETDTDTDDSYDNSADGTYDNEDGSVSEVVTDTETGDVTTTTTYENGAEVEQVTTVDGEISASITGITESTKVLIKTEDATLTDVAVIVYADGTEEIIMNTVLTEEGLTVLLSDDATIKIVNNSKAFDDVSDINWFSEAVDFVTSREIFNGTGTDEFSPSATMNRAMLWTALYRYSGGTGETTGANWYVAAQEWSQENGVSDGSNPTGNISREQIATILYRFEGEPEVTTSLDTNESISSWATDAMAWAVAEGLIQGDNNGNLNTSNSASRAEVSTILMRYICN